MNKPFVFIDDAEPSDVAGRALALGNVGFREMLRCALASRLFIGLVLVTMCAVFPVRQVFAQTVNIAAVPLLALKSAPGLVMLTMSRDHRLFYAAYNDASDLNGDGQLDVGFEKSITYYGYFVPTRCYAYDSSNKRFSPKSVASATDGCLSAPSSARWHGNWMNWATTSRMDALRRVLYGGYRVSDPTTTTGVTILEGSSIPADSHTWGKEFRPTIGGSTSNGPDTYNITHYTPLPTPTSSKQHSFMVKSASVANGVLTLNAPYLRIAKSVSRTSGRVWNWVADERPVGKDDFDGVDTTVNGTSSFRIRVEACVALSGVREAECQGYPVSAPTRWKPKGVLHDYSDQDKLKFGLLTGSYLNNYSGGVVRKDIGSFSDEIDASNGTFITSVNGIVGTIDKIRTYGFFETTTSGNSAQQAASAGSDEYLCGFYYAGLRNQGTCHMWGAPVAEMMYEGLRYFNAGTTGSAAPTSVYVAGVSGSTSPDTLLGLPTKTTWANPFRTTASGGSPICSRPVQMVISDPLTSFDTDQLPGAEAKFATTTGTGASLSAADKTITGLNVVTQADAIWTSEFGSATKKFFIGQSGTVTDGNPTAKDVTSFSNIRGHAPDEALAQGGYYAASVARFGKETGIKAGPGGGVTAVDTKVDTIAIALGSVVPPIKLTYTHPTTAVTNTVSLVPVLKTVAGSGVNTFNGSGAGPVPHQETGAITAFFVDQIANTTAANADSTVNNGYPYMRFLISFSNAGQGTDNETDLSAYYILRIDNVSKNPVVEINHFYEAAGRISTLGYVISGTTADGLYMELRKIGDTGTINYLDTRPGQTPAPVVAPFRNNSTALPIGISGATSPQVTRAFTFGSAAATYGTYVPHDPLWYAAKYGGAGVTDANGDPTNYFKISNPADLPDQMGKAFRSAAALAAVASTSVVGVGQRSLGSAAIYQANYDSLTWSSRLFAFSVATSGAVSNTPIWEVAAKIPDPALRTKLFLGRGGTTAPFALTSTGFSLMTSAEQTDFVNAATYSYLLGDKSAEERKGGTFRNRGTTAAADYGSVLGDIVNSDPQIISKRDLGYTASDATYTTFLNSIDFEMLAVGTNNGFFHIFDAEPDSTGGGELLGFMPQAARANIKYLPDPGYVHQNFVDGSIAVGHAKITVPGDATTNWRTVVVGAGGTGVKTVFAINATSKTFSANSILWEINSSTSGIGTTFGNIMGRPGIGKLADGTWVAIFGNGYNSTAGTANLYVVRLSDGNILRVIPTNASITANGLGSTELVRKTSGDQDTIDYVYGADYKGNIWRFDPASSSSGKLIYSTPTGRPITGEIRVGAAPSHANTTGGKMIYFGTGSYLSSTDTANTAVQALYGVYDDLLHSLSTSAFVTEASLSSMSIVMPAPVSGVTSDVRTTSAAESPAWYTVTGKKGWVVPLTGTNVTPGERVIAPPVRYTISGVVDAFLFTSIVPSTDECEAGLDAWITGVDALTGGYKKVFNGIDANSIRIRGGSPRGVFVLQDSGPPALYISQTIFNNTISTTSYTTSSGGQQTTCINGTCGITQVLKVDLTPPTPTTASKARQIWRQLK